MSWREFLQKSFPPQEQNIGSFRADAENPADFFKCKARLVPAKNIVRGMFVRGIPQTDLVVLFL
jgi:hypothetical protein